LVNMIFPDGADELKIVKFLDRVCAEKIVPNLNRSYEELSRRMNCKENRMIMAREAIASKGIWTGKKHYMLNVWNNEGVQYNEPKIKFVGIEAVRSSTPGICREMIKETIKVILNEDQAAAQRKIAECREVFFAAPAEEVAFPRTANKIDQYMDQASLYRKGTPMQVKAAIVYNDLLEKHKLTNRYERINSGDKIKFIYLKSPNTIFQKTVGFVNFLPKEFDLDQYVDYETQFEKAFLAPVDSIMKAINWNVEEIATLEAIFG